MPLDTTILLNIAEDLVYLHSEEAYRSIANRAYYSVFHECSKIGKKLNFSPYKNNFKHSELIKNFLSRPENELKVLGKQLEQARDLRAKADYKDQDTFDCNEANLAIATANAIMKNIKFLCAKMKLSP